MTAVNTIDTQYCLALEQQGAMWSFFHDLFRGPCEEQWEWLNAAPATEAWKVLAESLATNCPHRMPLPENIHDYEEEFIAVFEVGVPEPPCPLIESHWNKRDPLPKVLHENMLFYKQFGLELRSSANETADHLRHQLEFLRFLCQLEIAALSESSDNEKTEQIARARREFIMRHPAEWIPRAAEALQERDAPAWATARMRLLAAAIQAVQSIDDPNTD